MSKGWFLTLAILFGILAGGLVSELFDVLAPTGMVKTFFTKSIGFGVPAFSVDLGMFSFTLGLSFRFTVISLFILIVIVYYFRWWIK
jgi:hypothetical protein